MDLMDAILQRRTFRAYKDKAVEKDKLDKVLEAAFWAPSSMNAQPWKYYVCTGSNREEVASMVGKCTLYLDEMIKILGVDITEDHKEWLISFMGNLGGAPVTIIVTSPKTATEFTYRNNLLAVGASIQNAQLEAFNLGLGTCCLTASYWVRQQIMEWLGDADSELVTILLLGYPDETPDIHPRDYKADYKQGTG